MKAPARHRRQRLLLRGTALIALALLACEPGVPSAHPGVLDYASFDPQGDSARGVPALIPLPNTLALQPQSLALQNPSQAALLSQFAAQGGFPGDQEVPITIQFVRLTIDKAGVATRGAPPIDLATIDPTTLVVLGATGPVAYDAPVAADYAVVAEPNGAAHGELTLHKSKNAAGSRRWDPGTYAFAIRGGPAGVKTTDGNALNPEPAMYLVLQGRDLTAPDALEVIPGGTIEEKQATAAELESIRQSLVPVLPAFDASGFPHGEIATMANFQVAAPPVHVETDASGGLLPLPSDLLLTPDPVQGGALRLSPDAAPFFGPLGAGLRALDGFSTTAMMLMETSAPIQASSVNSNTVFVVELGPVGGTFAPRRLKEGSEFFVTNPEFVAQPAAVVQGGSSTVIGLQPATSSASLLAPGGSFAVPPLKEGTLYAVLVTKSVKDASGSPIDRSTLANILFATYPLTVNGVSQLSGISDGQAAVLEQMRTGINAAIATVHAEKAAVTADTIALAYTFRTQTMKARAVALAALPYATSTATLPAVGTPTVYTGLTGANALNNGFAQYGVDLTGSNLPPQTDVGSIIDVSITTLNKLDDAPGYDRKGAPATGAFTDPATAATPETIAALVVTPTKSGSCTPANSGGTWTKCVAPLAIFRHGFGRGRGDALLIAESLAAKGFVVAAIDAAKHGDRSFCATASECTSGAVCTPDSTLAGEGDAVQPGHCVGGDFARRGVLCRSPPCASAPEGIPAASGEYLLTANLFRTRDSLRQDAIDESQLIRVLAPNTSTATDTFLTNLTGYQINPALITFVGESLGGISGALDVATNPRIARAVLNAGGGTLVDALTNPKSTQLSPVFASILASAGVQPGTTASLRFANVAKWILDPADPINFAVNLKTTILTSPIATSPTTRDILGQRAACDNTVPDEQSVLLYGLTGLSTVSGGKQPGTQQVFSRGSYPYSCPGSAVTDTFLIDWVNNLTQNNATTNSQSDAAAFLANATQPPSVR